jgi:serine/threonine-protein kinase HipA
MIEIFHHDKLIATLQAENRKYILEYKDFELSNSISLSLPNTQKFYITEFDFIP